MAYTGVSRAIVRFFGAKNVRITRLGYSANYQY
jgi:hypothetical protein